jgi:hypothetical protein
MFDERSAVGHHDWRMNKVVLDHVKDTTIFRPKRLSYYPEREANQESWDGSVEA